MKIEIYLLLIFLISPFITLSQRDTVNSRWSVSANIGIGYPEGSFALKDEGNRYTYTGTAEFISATEALKNSIYNIVYMIGYNSNKFDLNGYLNDATISGLGSYGGQAISNGSYKEINALAGFSVLFPKHTKISVGVRFLLGISDSFYPYMEYYSFERNTQQVVRDDIFINSTSSLSIPFDVGLNLKIPMHNKIFILIGIDYLNSFAQWETTEQITSSLGNITQSYTAKSSIILIDVTGGIGYVF